jgi:hypothetical protein
LKLHDEAIGQLDPDGARERVGVHRSGRHRHYRRDLPEELGGVVGLEDETARAVIGRLVSTGPMMLRRDSFWGMWCWNGLSPGSNAT